MEKKCYFQYNLNIHILSQFLITLEKDFDPPKLSHPSVLSPLKASSLAVGNRTESQVGAQTRITQKKLVC